MVDVLKNRLIVYTIIIITSATAFWAHYPIGIHDSAVGWDSGQKVNLTYAGMNKSSHSNDPFLSEMPLEQLLIEVKFHRVMLKFFTIFETYFSLLNAMLLLIGISLLFELSVKLTKNPVFAVLVAILFSFSTINFSTGEIFAFFPVIGTNGKSIGFVFYLFNLILYFRLKDKPWGIFLLAVLMSCIVWIHPLSFIGPGLSAIVAGFLIFSWEARGTDILKKGLLTGIIVVVAAGGYAFSFVNWAGFSGAVLSAQEWDLIKQGFFHEYRYVYSPYSVFTHTLPTDFDYIKNYNILFGAAVCSFLFWQKLNRFTKFFLLSGVILVLSTFLIRVIDYWLFAEGTLKFVVLNRNLKWIYFFSFFSLISTYPELSDLIRSAKVRYSEKVVFGAFAFAVIFFLYEPLKSTNYNSYSKFKVKEKINRISLRVGAPLPFTTDAYTINQVNADTYQLVSYIVNNVDSQATFIGPTWLRYTTKYPVIYTPEDGPWYLNSKSPKYSVWKKQERILKSLDLNDRKNYIRSLQEIGADFFVLKKFIGRRDRSFESIAMDLSGLPIVFVNRSFAVMLVNEGRQMQLDRVLGQHNYGPRNEVKEIRPVGNSIGIADLWADKSSPQSIQSEITWKADVNDCLDCLSEFWVKRDDHKHASNFKKVQDFSALNSFVWRPDRGGVYDIRVVVKNDSKKWIDKMVLGGYLIYPWIERFEPDVKGPQRVGSPVTWTAQVSGAKPCEYEFWIERKGVDAWNVAQVWSESNVFRWIPRHQGKYNFQVKIREKGTKGRTDYADFNSYVIED